MPRLRTLRFIKVSTSSRILLWLAEGLLRGEESYARLSNSCSCRS